MHTVARGAQLPEDPQPAPTKGHIAKSADLQDSKESELGK